MHHRRRPLRWALGTQCSAKSGHCTGTGHWVPSWRLALAWQGSSFCRTNGHWHWCVTYATMQLLCSISITLRCHFTKDVSCLLYFFNAQSAHGQCDTSQSIIQVHHEKETWNISPEINSSNDPFRRAMKETIKHYFVTFLNWYLNGAFRSSSSIRFLKKCYK